VCCPSQIFHPNVNFDSGEICLDILKSKWTPAWGLEAACRAIIALLGDPDVDSPWNCDAGWKQSHMRCNSLLKELSTLPHPRALRGAHNLGNMIRAGDTMAFFSTARLYGNE
jgi:hypothetical protein